MKKLVFFPSDPIVAYIEKGRTYDYLDNYYNPGGYFDKVYCLSPWGNQKEETIGKIHYIKAKPHQFSGIIKKIGPNVIRGYGGYCCADWVSISKVKNIPTIVSVHDSNPLMIHKSLKYADALICMSEVVKKAVLEKVEFDLSKLWVMPNRVDIKLFSKKNDRDYFEKLDKRFGHGKHILHVGRKSKEKNLETVIRALKYLGSDQKCIFVGKGDTKKYRELAQKCGVIDRCEFIDRIPTEELPYWYSWCDCMCTPSKWEGFGCVFIEAAACEAAIVTSNIAPMNEYLTNGVNAILVDDYQNPKKIAEAILLAESNTEEMIHMRAAARNVGLHFTKDIIDKQEIEIYEKVMASGANNKMNYNLKLFWESIRYY